MNAARRVSATAAILASVLIGCAGPGSEPGPDAAATQWQTLPGNVSPSARAERVIGTADPDLQLEQLTLVLDTGHQADVEQLIADQQIIGNAEYHHWLTPDEFGARFGASDEQLGRVTTWLQSNGLSVDVVQAGRRAITFSGSVAQLEHAFHTTLQRYAADDGSAVIANATDPEVPVELGGLVGGVLGLSGFHHPKPMHVHPTRGGTHPDFAGPFGNTLAPADFAFAYDVTPAYTAGFDGTGQTIAIVGRTNINLSDVASFRSAVGLAAKAPVVSFVTTDPGIVSADEESEALLDTEWSGGVAKNATIDFVVGHSTSTADGVDLSLQFIVQHNTAPVVSMSFGQCESGFGSSGNAFFNGEYSQGVTQGQSFFISTGDSGVQGCTNASGQPTGGAAVSGLSSTPFNVAVGGTSIVGAVFNGSGALTSLGSEATWNDFSRGGGAGGGGVSTVYPKPSFQVSAGVPVANHRFVPDVSLQGSPNDVGFLFFQADQGGLDQIGGTSASAPSMAGVMALVVQKNGTQGNPNPRLYALGAAQYASSGPSVFRDVTAGNISFGGVTGPSAGTAYDDATGLGTPDVTALINNWTPTVTLSVAPTTTTLVAGGSADYSTTLARTAFNGAVTLAVNGVLPTGMTATFATNPTTGNSSTLTLATTTATPAGTYSFTVSGTGAATITTSNTFSITVTPANFVVLSVPGTSKNVNQGASTTYTIDLTRTNFAGAVTLALQGTAPGLTAAFAKNPTSSNSIVLTLSTTSATTLGTYSFSITGSATGATIVPSNTFSLVVKPAPAVALAVAPLTRSVTSGSAVTYTTTLARTNFTGAVTLTLEGTAPTGLTAAFTTNPVTAGSTTLTISTTAATPPGTYTFDVAGTATGAPVTSSVSFTVVVKRPPTVDLYVNASANHVVRGASIDLPTKLVRTNFPGAVTLTFEGSATGISASFATNPVTGTTTTLTIATSSSTVPGTYTFDVAGSASGATVNTTAPFKVVVTP